MIKKRIKRILLSAIVLILSDTILIANPAFILPPNLFSVEQEIQIRQYGHYLLSTNRSASLVDREVSGANLQPKEITGKIEERIIDYQLRFRYGVTQDWDIALGTRWRYKNRDSDVSVSSGSSPEAGEIAKRLASETLTGINHYFLEGRFSPSYDEETRWILGGALRWSPRSFSDRAGEPAVTQGNHGIDISTRWIKYYLSSENKFTFFLDTTFYLTDTVQSEEAKEINISRGNDSTIQMSYDLSMSQGYWGFDLRIERNGDIFSDTGDSLQDFSTSYLLQLKAEWNNLLSFPQEKATPFVLSARVGRVIAGFNTPVENRLTMELAYLF